MNRALLKRRLEALESRQSAAYVSPPPIPLALYIVAFFGGKYDAVQSPFTNYHRALGCERASDFHKLTFEQVAERHRKSWERICKRRGIDPETLQPWDAAVRMFKKLDKAGIVPAESWPV